MFLDKRDLSFTCVTHRHNFEIKNALASKRRMLLSSKVVNRHKFSISCMPDEVKPLASL